MKKQDTEAGDQELIALSLNGDKIALDQLIKKHQDWVYNIALNFVGDPDDASDIMQEVLIKAITKLDTFKQKSSFRTWLFRIAKNHFLNMKRRKTESPPLTFDQFGQGLDHIPDESLANYTYEVEEKLLVKEAKLSCMKGMLLCLDREQRLIFIIGELFEFPDRIGSEVMEISKGNFRVKLHRAKEQLYNFMNQKCGLVNKNNPCRCARKTAGFIKMGYVDPINLHFQQNVLTTVGQAAEQKVKAYGDTVMAAYQELYHAHPFLQGPPDAVDVQKLLSSESVRKTFNLD